MTSIDFNFDDYASLYNQYKYAMSLCQLSSMYIDDLDERLANALDYCAIVNVELSFQDLSSFFDQKFIDYSSSMLSLLHNNIVHHDTVVLYYYAKLKLLICRTASMFELILDPARKFNVYVQVCQIGIQDISDKFMSLIGFHQHVSANDIANAKSKTSALAQCIGCIEFPYVTKTHILDQSCMLVQLPYSYIKKAQFPNMLRYCITDNELYAKNSKLDVNMMQCTFQTLNLVAIGRHYSALVDMNCTIYSFIALQVLKMDVAALCFDIHKHDSHLYYAMNSKIVNDDAIERQLADFNEIASMLLKVVKTSDILF